VAISVDPERLWRVADLLWEYQFARIEPYEPVLMRGLAGTCWRVLLPPIIELHGVNKADSERMYVLDGMHRLYTLHERAVTNAMALIISSPHLAPLPARTPDSWEEVWRADAGQVSGEARFCGLNMPLLRPVSGWNECEEWELCTFRGKQIFPTEFQRVEDCSRRAKEILSVASG
jgi:hypothetical protein